MSTTLAFKYRIIYESLSRFSSALSRSTTLAEVKQCLQGQVKYLFDYQLVRFCFYQQAYYIIYSLVPTQCALECGSEVLLWAHERELKDKDMPIIIDDQTLIVNSLSQDMLPLAGTPTQLWGWHMGFTAQSGMMVSVYSGNGRQFQPTDVPILKIALENLYAKLLTIRLIDELGNSKQAVEQALLGLQEQSAIIARLVATQEDIIRKRTRELETKNTRLLHLSRQHAHTIREPLSRILSLAFLMEELSADEVINEIIPLLVMTSNELDGALQQVIQSIDTDLIPGDE
ncbi:hypothetical protein [Spirosoma flavum]|uniref:Histidine kinase n=1 Tax=Spirosoma flavum TaxID=2048557 RepID=A0ABW6AEY4_9BACT